MKKINLFVVATIMFFGSCVNNQPEEVAVTVVQYYTPTQLSPTFLNGQVKSATFRTFEVINDNGVASKGPLMSNQMRDSLGFWYDFKCEFDENGILQKTSYLDGDEVLSKWETTIEEGIITKAFYYKDDTIRNSQALFYDDNNHLKKVESFKKEFGELNTIYQVINNANGFPLKVIRLTAENEPKGKYILTRDEMNRTLEVKSLNKEDSLMYHSVSKYDEKGNWLESENIVSKNNAGKIYSSEHVEFDEKDNLIKHNFYVNGELMSFEELLIEYYE
jgi:hypothetical protein